MANTLVLTDIQECSMTLDPVDAAGNAATISDVPAWSVSDAALLTLSGTDATGLTNTVVSTGKLGAATINVTSAEGAGTLAVSIIASAAVGISVAPAAPIAIPVVITPVPAPTPTP